jgi:hypothetical protein
LILLIFVLNHSYRRRPRDGPHFEVVQQISNQILFIFFGTFHFLRIAVDGRIRSKIVLDSYLVDFLGKAVLALDLGSLLLLRRRFSPGFIDDLRLFVGGLDEGLDGGNVVVLVVVVGGSLL